MEICKEFGEQIQNIKDRKPLVHHITNYVTVNDCANITLAIGASPVMADSVHEVEEMVSIASSLVLNIGTINEEKLISMIKAGKKARELNIPVVLDPVGVGATAYRKEAVDRIIKNVHLDIIRGNFSEIKTIFGLQGQGKGVDSEEIHSEKEYMEEAIYVAKELSKKLDSAIALSGAIDIIAEGDKVAKVFNGHEIMTKVTGTGCMSASLIGSFLGAKVEAFKSAIFGTASMGISGEMAYEALKQKENQGIGTYRVNIIDSIYNLNYENICKRAHIEVEG
ncbi:hydroxyethylthiazole kinase [Clostridium sp. MSJ-4]|uniref:Hydroxyethylthiazole kinase n=1 Tax=Clostridium simiarum TaxID=2841506 RepID=A0ABS6EZN4_9CLOT|nr:hydroxyethylthiazole kinase [Clostridium simiarum]MBU5591438.1 hydroxyethylthiazole kinase [Clostridium simiarum]